MVDRREFVRRLTALAGAGASVIWGEATTAGKPQAGPLAVPRDTPSPSLPASPAPLGALPSVVSFTSGTRGSFDLKPYLPAGQRYAGGWRDRRVGYQDQFPAMYMRFDAATKRLSYDGSRQPATVTNEKIPNNPNPDYVFGSETGPFNTHWSYPPTYKALASNQFGSLTGGLPFAAKHTRARYCPLDQKIHIFGGDWDCDSTLPVAHAKGSNSTMLQFACDPVTNTWTLDYPQQGRSGEVFLLNTDQMGFTWDSIRNIWWHLPGVSRAGFADQAAYTAAGGLCTVLIGAGGHLVNVVTLNPSGGGHTSQVIGADVPWQEQDALAAVHDPGSDRIYVMVNRQSGFPIADVGAYYLDCANPSAGWTLLTFNLTTPGAPENLTGGFYSALGPERIFVDVQSQTHVDTTAKQLYFLDFQQHSVWAMTLPGNSAGAHKIKHIATLPVNPNVVGGYTMLLSMAWVDAHRKLVVFWDPLGHDVGPFSASFTVDVDTEAVTQGPRWPSYDDNATPCAPGGCCWHPPTGQLMVYSVYGNESHAANLVGSRYALYAWNPAGVDATGSGWTWTNYVSAGTIPAYVPQPGKVAPISLNTPDDVYSCRLDNCPYDGGAGTRFIGRGSGNLFNPWCGGVFASGRGPYGSIVHGGGGHADGGSNEEMAFDFSTRLWTRTTNPHLFEGKSWICSNYPTWPNPGQCDPANPTAWPYDPFWMDFLDDHSPLASHTYNLDFYLPGSLVGNTNGWKIRPFVQANASAGTWGYGAHYLDLDTNTWHRYGPLGGYNAQACGGVFHPPSRTYFIPQGAGGKTMVFSADYQTFTWGSYTATNVGVYWGAAHLYDSVSGLILGLTQVNTLSDHSQCGLYLLDPANPSAAKMANVIGAPPVNNALGFQYCDVNDTFYICSGGTGNVLGTLKRPTSGGAWNGTWVFGTETFTGTAPPTTDDRVFSKFFWVPALRSFAYYGSVTLSGSVLKATGSVYLFRPHGT